MRSVTKLLELFTIIDWWRTENTEKQPIHADQWGIAGVWQGLSQEVFSTSKYSKLPLSWQQQEEPSIERLWSRQGYSGYVSTRRHSKRRQWLLSQYQAHKDLNYYCILLIFILFIMFLYICIHYFLFLFFLFV